MDEINSINSMLIECVKAAGGSKRVGPLLWPEKPVLDAQKLLLACLNEDRPEKLSPDQAFLIERLQRDFIKAQEQLQKMAEMLMKNGLIGGVA
jgi:hypothetical protein